MKFPAAIAVIPDGNRRFAQENTLSLADAYRQGFGKVEKLVSWLEPTPVKAVKLWALSMENFERRSTLELQVLFELIKHQLRASLADERFTRNGFSVRFIGQRQKLPSDVQGLMERLEQSTAGGSRFLDVAVAYSGQAELTQAAQKAAEDYKSGRIDAVDEATFSKYLYSSEPVDLVIRTGGVQRLSGFLPWQNAYAEVYFSRKMWPQFEKADLDEALAFYGASERRFGK